MYQYTRYYVQTLVVLLLLSIFVVFMNLYASQAKTEKRTNISKDHNSLGSANQVVDSSSPDDDNYQPRLYVYDETDESSNLNEQKIDNSSQSLTNEDDFATQDDDLYQ